MIEEGGYSICKCRFRFGLTFRSSLPREPAIEASSFQTMNKCPAKRLLKAPLLLHPFYFFSLNHRDNVYGTGSLISRHIPILVINWLQCHFIQHEEESWDRNGVGKKKWRKKRGSEKQTEQIYGTEIVHDKRDDGNLGRILLYWCQTESWDSESSIRIRLTIESWRDNFNLIAQRQVRERRWMAISCNTNIYRAIVAW